MEAIEAIQNERGTRVITLIHREESVSLLGIPISKYIDIDDAEAALRAIRLTPADKGIDLILHTPGGLVLAASQIAHALKNHQGKVTVFVPHYAMSGGTLLALSADEIVMDPKVKRKSNLCEFCVLSERSRTGGELFIYNYLTLSGLY